MENIIRELVGKRIEINCGNGVAFSGENLGIEGGVLQLSCDGKKFYVDIAKVITINEATDTGGKPGFIA